MRTAGGEGDGGAHDAMAGKPRQRRAGAVGVETGACRLAVTAPVIAIAHLHESGVLPKGSRISQAWADVTRRTRSRGAS
jgi:hypothetical protein